MTWMDLAAVAAASCFGTTLAIRFARPKAQPRHTDPPTSQPFPLDEADMQRRGRADRPRHVQPGEGDL